MTEFQRSVTSFRRQGSSGLVWDDKFIAGLENQNPNQEAKASNNQNQQGQREVQGVESSVRLERSRSDGARPYRTVNVAPASMDPPSPKVATCGFCSVFRKPGPAKSTKAKRRR
ncbi:uncharacterized protein At1g15400 [Vigna unguiculata]|uniref:MAPK kinase substrate protein n=1 Tax=Vigna unguiculata TaxID=3917 RepID=A0A4D6KX61_VIGUN|nr:uncharacterized protein At1g15400 [Vigna unguiculata]QCD80667.1 hypothetical protein DEO72_LG2g989 [Vigna unguiculata]